MILTCPGLLRDCRRVLADLRAHLNGIGRDPLAPPDRGAGGRLVLVAAALDLTARVAAWHSQPGGALRPGKTNPATLVRAAGSDRACLDLALRLARLEARLLRMTARPADS